MRRTNPSFLEPDSTRQAEGLPKPRNSIEPADVAAMAVLVGELIALFGKVIFTPAMFFYRDVFNYSYPHARFIHEACRHGYLPYWNPYWNYGEPLLANPNFLFFYPYTLFIILLPVDLAYTLHYVAHFALAGTGTYWLARRWGQSCLAALFAASVFLLSGPVLSLGNLYNHAACSAWIPWALLVTDRALRSHSRRPWLILTLVFALQFLASEPLTLLATFGLCVIYALYCAGTKLQRLPRTRLQILAGFIAVGCLMLMLCAVQFLPSLDLLSHSSRGAEGLSYRASTIWSFHPLSLLEMVVPDLFGDSLNAPSLWTLILSDRLLPYFPSVFVGFVPFFFALLGWALSRDPRRNFAAGAGFTFFLLALGRYTPVYALAYLLVPPLALVRFPVKLLIPAVLLIAVLGGWGVDALGQSIGNPATARARLILLLKVLLACAALVWIACYLVPKLIEAPAGWILLRTAAIFAPSRASELGSGQSAAATEYLLRNLRLLLPGLVGFLLGGLVWLLALERGRTWARRALPFAAILGIAQLVWVNSRANPTVPKSFYTYRPPVLDHFEASDSPNRFSFVTREAASPSRSTDSQGFISFESIHEAAGLSPLAAGAFRDKLLLARGSMLEGVEGSFNEDVELSGPPSLYEFWRFAVYHLAEPSRIDCLLGRTNVKYEILRTRQPDSALREVAPVLNGSTQPSYLYENLCAVPRVYVASKVIYSKSAEETLTLLSSPDFDAKRKVILLPGPDRAPSVVGSDDAGRVEIVDRAPNTVKLRANLRGPGHVVLLDRFDPNWLAEVDGREVPILRANLLFRAVRADAGEHVIRFYYRQRGLKAGLFVSLSTLVLMVVLCCHEPGRRERL